MWTQDELDQEQELAAAAVQCSNVVVVSELTDAEWEEYIADRMATES